MSNTKLILLTLFFIQILDKSAAQSLVPDLTFGSAGIVHHNPTFSYCAIGDASGNYFVGGPFTYSVNAQFAVTKLLNDGSLDSSFGVSGVASFSAGFTQQHISDLAIQNDGKIVFVGGLLNGSDWNGIVGRLTIDGNLDTTFNSIGYSIINVNNQYDNLSTVVIQIDGKAVVGGTTCYGGVYDDKFAAWRFNTDGTPDSTFYLNGLFRTATNGSVSKVILDGNEIVLGGHFENPDNDYCIIRLDAFGFPDPSFGTSGVFLYPRAGNNIIADLIMDGYNYIAVSASYVGNPTITDWKPEIFRVTFNGLLDPTAFGGGIQTLNVGNYSVIPRSIIKSGTTVTVGGYGFNTGGFGMVNNYNGVFYQVNISNGALNTSNGINGLVSYGISGVREEIQYVNQEPNGKIVFIGGEGNSGNFISKYVNSSVGFAELESSSLAIYPNPASDYFEFNMKDQACERLEIRDLFGRLYSTEDVKLGNNHIQPGELASGCYLINILDKNGTNIHSLKLFIK